MTTRTATRGVLYVHSAPSALCPHIEWAVGGVLGVAVNMSWTPNTLMCFQMNYPVCPQIGISSLSLN